MAWRYDDEDCLVRDITDGDPTENRVVCWVNGAANHGPLIALAPRMEAWMRTFGSRKLTAEDFARLHDEAQMIFRELDEARAEAAT